jgi:hypothetical protein
VRSSLTAERGISASLLVATFRIDYADELRGALASASGGVVRARVLRLFETPESGEGSWPGAVRLRLGDSEEVPPAGYAFELVFASVGEGDGGPGEEVDDRA